MSTPLNGLSTGIQHQLVLVDSTGVQQFVAIESFTSKYETERIKRIAIDGVIRYKRLEQGLSGSFKIQRLSPVIEAYFANAADLYYSGLDQDPVTINETILENNGSVTQYQYVNCVLLFEDQGTWSGTDTVDQMVSFEGALKKQVNV